MGVRRSASCRLQADLKSILHARAGPDFPALRIQPLQTGRSRDFEEPPGTQCRVIPVEASDFTSKSALFLPKEAQYEYLVNLPADIASAQLKNQSGHVMNSLGEVVNNAMELVEAQSEQLTGVLPKDYTMFSDELLAELLRIFNNSALDEVGGDIIGRIYEYFLNKFAKNIARTMACSSRPNRLSR